MKKKPFALTKHEKEVMDVLWKENRALSRSEILTVSEERSWKDSTIHILINQLLAKEAIEVDGFVKTNKNFGRTYKAALSESEYQVLQFKSSNAYKDNQENAVVNFMSALFNEEEIEASTIDKLQDRRKQKIGEKIHVH